MSLFSRRPRRQVGIDIGTSSIKVVELSREGSHPKLLNYGIMDGLDFFGEISPTASVPSKLKMSEDDIVTVLNKVFEFSKVKTRNAVFSIPVFSSFLTIMELPHMSVKELKRAVDFQARSYIPVPLSEVVLDWLPIPPRPKTASTQNAKKVGLDSKDRTPPPTTPTAPNSFNNLKGPVGTNIVVNQIPQQGGFGEKNVIGNSVPQKPENDLLKMQEQTEQKGVIISSKIKKPTEKELEKKPEKISVLLVAVPKEVISKYQRVVAKAKLNLQGFEPESFSLERAMLGNDLNTTMLVDFGARSTNLTIIDQGFVRMSHGVDMSGKEITRSISRGLNISLSRANDLKKSAGISSQNADRGIADLVKPILGKLVIEFEKMNNLYMRKEGAKVKKIILAGGSAGLPGLVEYLSDKLLTEVIIGDPFARINYPKELEKLKKEIAPSLSVSVGLAMRDF